MVRLQHSAVWAKASCQRVSRDILIDPDQDAAGFDQDMRGAIDTVTSVLTGPFTMFLTVPEKWLRALIFIKG
jgi:hypothetical protein